MSSFSDLAGVDDECGSGHHVRPGTDNTGEDDIAQQLPPSSVGQNERRMQVRAYNYWASLLVDRPFPRIEDIVAADVPNFADYAVVLDFSKTITDPAVAMLGKKLAEECGAAISIKRLSDVPGGSLLSRITDHCRQILAIQAPIGFEAEFINQRGKTLLYRSILLPFSSDGENIQHILGVINWKELADPLMTAELRHELEITVGATLAQTSGQQLGAWADGPAAAEPVGLDATFPLNHEIVTQELADWLAVAREAVEDADRQEQRSRVALHEAIGRTWDFVLAATAQPRALREIVAEAGQAGAARTPMVEVVELLFSDKCNKIRRADLTTVLAHARRKGLECGTLAAFLHEKPGGIKRVVREELALCRRRDNKA